MIFGPSAGNNVVTLYLVGEPDCRRANHASVLHSAFINPEQIAQPRVESGPPAPNRPRLPTRGAFSAT
jgi:hypothetical protein